MQGLGMWKSSSCGIVAPGKCNYMLIFQSKQTQHVDAHYDPPVFSFSGLTMTDTQPLYVTKRDGRREPIDLDKIHRVLEWAAEGLRNVSVSQVELKSHIQFYDGIRTRDIHETIIKAA